MMSSVPVWVFHGAQDDVVPLSDSEKMVNIGMKRMDGTKAEVLKLDPARARNTFSLNGLWQIQPGAADRIPSQFDHEVPVPSLVDCAEPSYAWKSFDYHYYRKLFRIVDPRSQSAPLLRTGLRIGQAMFGTSVWLNGFPQGDDIGCYTSQEYDLSNDLRYGGENELIVRVGGKETLPPKSAVGKDQERNEFIPGIWGDVELSVTGNPRIRLVQAIPRIGAGSAEIRFWVENRSDRDLEADLTARIVGKRDRAPASGDVKVRLEMRARSEVVVTADLPIRDLLLWSPHHPFLYAVEAALWSEGRQSDAMSTTFGMREFRIAGRDFVLNGKKIFLRGGNIAFHRFLSDGERGTLPWNMDWVKRVLIDIPKAHNFNFFRNHLGQMYHRWYDIADEHGMLLQNEWQFWTTTGTKEQITKEFTRWLQDNWNHPSIVIWDPLNESKDDTVQREIVPEMKKLDPTRPWESVDVAEDHPYIYSLGPVLNDTAFGFTRSLREIEDSTLPTIVNEFNWWWLNNEGEPTVLMDQITERWLGPGYAKEDLLQHQAFLVQELVELFRRMKVGAIQPFVYLSNNEGPTAHWFLGPVAELRPKPVLAALKNAFSPFGISLELWDRHFAGRERRSLDIVLFNDGQGMQNGVVEYGIVGPDGGWIEKKSRSVSVDGGLQDRIRVEVEFPDVDGSCKVRAELRRPDGAIIAWSEKVAHVLSEPIPAPSLGSLTVGVWESSKEIETFLTRYRVSCRKIPDASMDGCDVLFVAHGEIRSSLYREQIAAMTEFVRLGGTLIIIEPESGVGDGEEIAVVDGLDLSVTYREDNDRGGYDSYVFATDQAHPLWKGIGREHLKMFNGGYGGEIVSQHNVVPNKEPEVLARCGLGLKIPAVMEIRLQPGRVILSRLQVRNRLSIEDTASGLFARRMDPVVQRYVLNLTDYGCAAALTARTIGSVPVASHPPVGLR